MTMMTTKDTTLEQLIYSQGLKAGSKVYLEGGEFLLVGDINELGGVCDDCSPYKTCVVVMVEEPDDVNE